MAKMRVAGIDPALQNWGMCLADINLDTFAVEPVSLKLVKTEKGNTGKQVRQNSDDLRRAGEITKAFQEFIAPVQMVFTEMPVGSQSARAMAMYGCSIGILGGCTKPLIQVMPLETKIHTVGKKTATKDQMIEWAHARHPDLNWLTYKRHGEVLLTGDNEHLADALSVIYAGIQTQQFRQLVAMMQAAKAA